MVAPRVVEPAARAIELERRDDLFVRAPAIFDRRQVRPGGNQRERQLVERDLTGAGQRRAPGRNLFAVAALEKAL